MSLVFGLVIMVMIYAGGHLSGAHYNPCVTVAFVLARHFPPRDASRVRRRPGHRARSLRRSCCSRPGPTSRPTSARPCRPSKSGTALLYEVVLTAFLMFVITAVATDTRAVGAAAAIAIGGTVGLDALFGGPITGASMNPARSLGPRSPPDTWSDFWIYLAGPLAGAASGCSPTSWSAAAGRQPRRRRRGAATRRARRALRRAASSGVRSSTRPS